MTSKETAQPGTPAHNLVQLHPDGYLEIKLVGDQTFESVDQVRKAVEPIVRELQVRDKPILGLVDVSQETASSTGSRRAGLGLLEVIHYDRVAFIVESGLIGASIDALLAALGKHENTQMFHDRDTAVLWLLEYHKPLV